MIDDQDDRRADDSLGDTDLNSRRGPSAPLKKEPLPEGAAAEADEDGFATDSPREKLRRQAEKRRLGAGADEPEEHLWQGGYSPKAMVGTWLLCVLLTIAAIVATVLFEQLPWLATLIAIVLLWIIVAAVYASRRLGVHYQLTTQRFIHQTGIFSRRTDRIEVIDIDDVSYHQGPVQRMFGTGSIRIDSSDRSHPELTMQGISNVHEVAGLIDDIRRKERRRRSLHIESV